MSRVRTEVLALFVADRVSASSRLRALQYADMLTRDGVAVRICATRPSKYLPRPSWLPAGHPALVVYQVFGMVLVVMQRVWQICSVVPRVDVVLLQKDLIFRSRLRALESLLFLVARVCNVRLVFDVDDAIYLGTSIATLPYMYPKIAAIARSSDVVLAGSETIARELRPHAQELRLAPTCVKLRQRPKRTYEIEAGTVHMVWTGTASNARHLDSITEPLRSLNKLIPLQLEIVTRLADLPTGFPQGLNLRLTEWSEHEEAAALRRADIALAPLGDSRWAKSKCGGRILAYFAAALPVVASPVGAQGDMVRHRTTGLHATTADDWRTALEILVANVDLRARLGRAGRDFVETTLDADKNYPQWREWVLGSRAGSSGSAL